MGEYPSRCPPTADVTYSLYLCVFNSHFNVSIEVIMNGISVNVVEAQHRAGTRSSPTQHRQRKVFKSSDYIQQTWKVKTRTGAL